MIAWHARCSMRDGGLMGHRSTGDARDDTGPSRWWQGANLLLGLVLLGAVVVVVRNLGEGARFAELVRRARPEWLVAGVLAQLGTYVCSSMIWYRIAARHSRAHLGFWRFFGLGFAKLFVDQVVPSAGIGGTLVVVRGLARRGLSRRLATAAVLVDLVAFYGGQSVAVIGALALILVQEPCSPWIALTAGLFLALAIVVPAFIFWGNHHGARAVPPPFRRIRVLRRFLATLAAAPKSVVRDVPLNVECIAWQLGVIVLDALTLAAMLRGLGVEPTFTAVLAAHVLASAVASLGIVPAGLGLFEATSIATLRLLDVPLEAALAATLLARGLMLWLPLVPGLVVTRAETRPLPHAPAHAHASRHG
jgi:uncharacterized protein (TIRG00374 family)